MLTLKGEPPFLAEMYDEYKKRSRTLYAEITAYGTPLRLQPEQDLFRQFEGSDTVFYIVEGFFRLKDGEKFLRLYSGDDFVVAPGSLSGRLTLTSDMATDVVRFDFEQLVRNLSSSYELNAAWLRLMDTESKINAALCSLYREDTARVDFSLREYGPGETIIREGDEPCEIFEMISGAAEVLTEGRVIGTIGVGELFGEISFLTESTRTATVRASEKSLVRVADKQAFLHMIKHNPELIMTISRTLAQRLVRMNDQITGG